MSQFEDEPEDYWHPDDPVAEQIRNLRLRLGLLFTGDAPIDSPLVTELEVIAAALGVARRRRLSERNLLRADDLEADLEYVWDRLG